MRFICLSSWVWLSFFLRIIFFWRCFCMCLMRLDVFLLFCNIVLCLLFLLSRSKFMLVSKVSRDFEYEWRLEMSFLSFCECWYDVESLCLRVSVFFLFVVRFKDKFVIWEIRLFSVFCFVFSVFWVWVKFFFDLLIVWVVNFLFFVRFLIFFWCFWIICWYFKFFLVFFDIFDVRRFIFSRIIFMDCFNLEILVLVLIFNLFCWILSCVWVFVSCFWSIVFVLFFFFDFWFLS